MDARTVVRADALFEAALGLALVIGAVTGAFDAADFPQPVGGVVVAAVGVLLLAVSAALWRGHVSVAALAAGNLVTALAALVWLAIGSGFSTAGETLIAVTAAALVCLAAAQVATLRH